MGGGNGAGDAQTPTGAACRAASRANSLWLIAVLQAAPEPAGGAGGPALDVVLVSLVVLLADMPLVAPV